MGEVEKKINSSDIITKCVYSGQPRRYADSISLYTIECDERFNDEEVLEYCKNNVCKCKYSYGDNRPWYENYYTFKKINSCNSGDVSNGNNKFYEYKVVTPYTD